MKSAIKQQLCLKFTINDRLNNLKNAREKVRLLKIKYKRSIILFPLEKGSVKSAIRQQFFSSKQKDLLKCNINDR